MLTVEFYRRLAGSADSIVDLLAMPGMDDIGFDPAPAQQIFRPADFT